ncbi:MAG: GAF and ANTAR domain-containing protein [Acidimicrobiales bacterium]
MTNRDMDLDRMVRVIDALAVGERDPRLSLCSASAGVVGVRGAGLVLVSGGRNLGNACVSDAVIETVENVQYTLGEGPCIDAFATRTPVLVADLADSDGRWLGFREGALVAGMRAAFGFPLMIGTSCIGALNLFHDQPGALSDVQYADAVAVAHVASRTLLGWQSAAEPGLLAWQLERAQAHRAVVHQATGMISIQSGLPVGDAIVLLRAHAFAEGRPVSEIAAEVVGRRLRLG